MRLPNAGIRSRSTQGGAVGSGVSPAGPGGKLPRAYTSGVKRGPKSSDLFAADAPGWPRLEVIGGWICRKDRPDAPWVRVRALIAGLT